MSEKLISLGASALDKTLDEALDPADREFFEQPREISNQEFLSAMLDEQLEEVAKMIIHDERLVHSRDAAGATAVQLAVYLGLDDVLGVLLRSDVALHFHEAASVGDVDRVAELIADDADRLDSFSGDGFTALVLAATFGREPLVEALLEAGASASLPARNPTRTAPLHAAAGFTDAEVALRMVEGLLAAGATVDIEQAGGFTPLHQAASRGHARIVEALLAADADPTVESDLGKTAGDLAKQRGHREVIELLSR